VLVVWDDDADPYNKVREWWNSAGNSYPTPRQHLFKQLGLEVAAAPGLHKVGKGKVLFRAENPAALASDPKGDATLITALQTAIPGSRIRWRETNYLMLRRGPYVLAAGLDESIDGPARDITGVLVNLFDPELKVQSSVKLAPGTRFYLLDLARKPARNAEVLASACKVFNPAATAESFRCLVEGIANTPGAALLRVPRQPGSVALDGKPLEPARFDATHRLLLLKFPNEARPRELTVTF
jgi:hypothetical protein